MIDGSICILDKDFSNLSYDIIFKNIGEIPIYKDFNDISLSFSRWKNSIIKKLEENNSDIEYNDIINPKEYIMANINDVFEKMYDKLITIGDLISSSYNEYEESLFNEIRDDYINKKLLTKN